jgi:hypothetical protein
LNSTEQRERSFPNLDQQREQPDPIPLFSPLPPVQIGFTAFA